MRGYIKIEATTHNGAEGLSVECHLAEVSVGDKLAMVEAVMHALHFDSIERLMLLGVISGKDSTIESVDAWEA